MKRIALTLCFLVSVASNSMAYGGNKLLTFGVVFGGLSLVSLEMASKNDRLASDHFEKSSIETNWKYSDDHRLRGGAFRTRARRYRDLGAYLAIASISCFTARAIKLSIHPGGVFRLTKEFKFK